MKPDHFSTTWAGLVLGVAVALGQPLKAEAGVCDAAGLADAVAAGGTVTFDCDATIVLTNTLAITRDVVLDASGHNVAISGGNAVRLFTLSPGVRAIFNNLALVDGRYQGTNGLNDNPGEPAYGGAIYNNGGQVELRSCVLSNNAAIGGQGGAAGVDTPPPGGLANGGAIYNALGTLTLTN